MLISIRAGESSNRQAHPHPRPRILLPFRVRRGHTSDRRHRPLLSSDVRVSNIPSLHSSYHSYTCSPHRALTQSTVRYSSTRPYRRHHLPEAMLRQQRFSECGDHRCWVGQGAGAKRVQYSARWRYLPSTMGYRRFWVNIRLRVLRCDVQGWLERRTDRSVCQKQYVLYILSIIVLVARSPDFSRPPLFEK